MNPLNCDESTYVHNVYICHLDSKPCPVLYGESHYCALERMEALASHLGKILFGDKNIEE